ncbi:hypothetical protein JGI13_01862, partial [Candidatus Kryptonium thompsonii]
KRNFGGSLPLYVLVKGDVQDPQVLQEIKKVEDFLKSLEDVHNPQSIVDIIEEMNHVMGEGRKIPETREKIANLIFLIEGEEIFNQLVSPDKDEAIIQAMVTYASSNKISELVNKIQSYFNSVSDKGNNVKFEQTGMPLIYNISSVALTFVSGLKYSSMLTSLLILKIPIADAKTIKIEKSKIGYFNFEINFVIFTAGFLSS